MIVILFQKKNNLSQVRNIVKCQLSQWGDRDFNAKNQIDLEQ